MTFKVLVCDEISESGIKLLRNAGFQVDIKFNITPEQLKQTIAEYDAAIVRSRTIFTKEILEAGRKLKVVGRAGVGLDNIDVETAKKRGVEVLNTPEALTASVAELTIALMLSLAREILRADRAMKEGKWIKKELMGTSLRKKTLGIVGFGRIGAYVASIAKALGMNILVTDPHADPQRLKEVDAQNVPLNVLLKESDFVSLHVPLTPETHHMIGEKQLQLMKHSAFLINTSRGAVVDEKALLTALQSGKLAGAALDVYEVEPPADLTLVKMSNTICTPHIGAQTEEAQELAATIIAEKVISSLKRQQ